MPDDDPSAGARVPDALRVREVAARLGCHHSRVYRLIAGGYLRTLPGPGAMLVTGASYREYLASADEDAS